MRNRLLALVAAGVIAVTPLASRAAAKPVASLKVGQGAFWPASKVTPVDGGETNNTATGPRYTWHYIVQVAPGGHLLRVGIDWASYLDYHSLQVTSPTGDVIAAGGYQSAEAYAEHPGAGTWEVLVSTAGSEPDFRMRARLEPAAPKPSGHRALLPNLRLIPPFDFTFANPYRQVFVGQPGTLEPGAAVPNCWWDEIAENSARRCLRFSLGPINAGDGPFQITVTGGTGAGVATPTPVKQTITYTDGTTTERDAGAAIYHKTHMHYHHMGFGRLELMKVTDPKRGTMVLAGTGPKQGFCTADVVMYQWKRWAGHQNEVYSQCLHDMGPTGTFSPTGTAMGITPGWADIYAWNQSGNYVEFGTNGDGRYIVRSKTDEGNQVLESNESDNSSYAYIQITGTTIKVLERGFGTSPWDPRKQLADDILRPVPRGYSG